MSKKRAIIVDIDGTLADSRHRVHHIVNPEGKVDWAGWDSQAHLDPVFPWCADLVYAMRSIGVKPIYLTGRGERLREVTRVWLARNIQGGQPNDMKLLMRAEGDHRQDTVIKEEIYRRDIEPHYDVLFAIDDKGSVVDMWRSIGLVCLECDRWTAEMENASKHYVKPEHVKK